MGKKQVPEITSLPQPPSGSAFRLQKVEVITMPHLYCITPKHVAVAADYHVGILDESAIEDAESRGAKCGICVKAVRCNKQNKVLSYREHEQNVTLFIVVPQNKDLNAVQNLGKWLSDNKEKFTSAGIDGFAFPTEAQLK